MRIPMFSPSTWASPPASLRLRDNEVHVWRAKLDLAAQETEGLQATLAADEVFRAERFRFARDRNRFVAARGILREILAGYTGGAPADLRFWCSPFGKPHLAPDAGGGELCFNLSHSDGLALFAVARRRRIGVDLEAICPTIMEEGIAERNLTPTEVSTLRTLPACQQVEAFFHCWTRKEACLKAWGWGFATSLASLEVSLAPDQPAGFLNGVPCGWSLVALQPGTGYAGALAVEGRSIRLRRWEWRTNHSRRES
jgi:4'-phosphopantetheinyl transferase